MEDPKTKSEHATYHAAPQGAHPSTPHVHRFIPINWRKSQMHDMVHEFMCETCLFIIHMEQVQAAQAAYRDQVQKVCTRAVHSNPDVETSPATSPQST